VTQRLLKPGEVAARLQVSRSWVYSAAKSGELPSIALGPHPGAPIRFVEAEVDEWLERQRRTWHPGRRR
jgi:excisionase family DNA binding protein